MCQVYILAYISSYIKNNFFLFLFYREDTKVSHYIINKIQQNDQIVYRIGDQQFSDLPELLGIKDVLTFMIS